jgi:hypothetical protein
LIESDYIPSTCEVLTPRLRTSVPFPTAEQIERRRILDSIAKSGWFDLFIKLNSREEISWRSDEIAAVVEAKERGSRYDVHSIVFNVWERKQFSRFLRVSVADLNYVIQRYAELRQNGQFA